MISRPLYRARQFGQALAARMTPEARAEVQAFLTPPLWALFTQMQRSEQYHAWLVWQTVRADTGDSALPDLQIAALLHDLGKSCAGIRLWERVLVVLGRRLLPRQAAAWGKVSQGGRPQGGRPQGGRPRGGLRAFAVAAQHPDWGADRLAEAGGSPLAVWLIRNHQNFSVDSNSGQADLLRVLMAADDAH